MSGVDALTIPAMYGRSTVRLRTPVPVKWDSVLGLLGILSDYPFGVLLPYGANLRTKGHWVRKCENRFLFIFSSKLIDLRQSKTKVIIGPFHIVRYISPAKVLRFVIFVCNYPGGSPGRVLTCFRYSSNWREAAKTLSDLAINNGLTIHQVWHFHEPYVGGEEIPNIVEGTYHQTRSK